MVLGSLFLIVMNQEMMNRMKKVMERTMMLEKKIHLI